MVMFIFMSDMKSSTEKYNFALNLFCIQNSPTLSRKKNCWLDCAHQAIDSLAASSFWLSSSMARLLHHQWILLSNAATILMNLTNVKQEIYYKALTLAFIHWLWYFWNCSIGPKNRLSWPKINNKCVSVSRSKLSIVNPRSHNFSANTAHFQPTSISFNELSS